MALSSLSENFGSGVEEAASQISESMHTDMPDSTYAVDPIEKALWNLAHKTNYQNLAQADRIDSILAPDVPSIRLAELKR